VKKRKGEGGKEEEIKKIKYVSCFFFLLKKKRKGAKIVVSEF
jgi:hypothetical protein